MQHRSSELIELKHFGPASVEDISSVHKRAYVLGLEKVSVIEPVLILYSFEGLSATPCPEI